MEVQWVSWRKSVKCHEREEQSELNETELSGKISLKKWDVN